MNASSSIENAAVSNLTVSAYKIPTETPESDGTLKWDSTTLVLVKVTAAGKTGMGYSYVHQSAAVLIDTVFRDLITGMNCFDIGAAWNAMVKETRNQGNSGIAYMAVSAVDCALWDLKAKLLGLPLIKLLGQFHESMPLYGSGGFTSYSVEKLQDQLNNWVSEGFKFVKMKIGREPDKDLSRIKAAREAIGNKTELFVDANGAYSPREAVAKAIEFKQYDVTWYEEPVSSDDLQGLHLIRQQAPPTIDIAAGEYGFNRYDFRNMLQAEAIDVLQIDVTRCGGVTGFLEAANLCEAFQLPFSTHCAPSLHLSVAPAFKNFGHAEYFYDHVRIEQMLFDGYIEPQQGRVKPNLERPGFGLAFKEQDADEYKI